MSSSVVAQRELTATVRSIRSDAHIKFLNLDSGERLAVHRFAAVGERDPILLSESNGRRDCRVPCVNGHATIEPTYDELESVDIGFAFLRVRTKEITQPDELQGFKHLADFHY